MKAVMASVRDDILEARRRSGADQWDEMWEGVLHMPPIANREHQDLAGEMYAWLREYWGSPTGSRVHPPVNVASVGGWPNDYRIPDVVLLTPDRFHIDRNEYFEGGPTVVVEVRSPDDETYDKLPFYAKLGVPEVWVIDRDTKTPEVYVLRGGRYAMLSAAADGWLASPATGVRLCVQATGTEPKLAMQMADDESTRRLVPQR